LAEVPRDLICEECALGWGRSPNNVLVCASTCHKKPSNQSIINAVETWIPGLSIARLGARLSVNSWMQSVNPVQKAKQSPSKGKILKQKTGQSERVVLLERIHALEAAASLQEEMAAAEKAALKIQLEEQKTIAQQMVSKVESESLGFECRKDDTVASDSDEEARLLNEVDPLASIRTLADAAEQVDENSSQATARAGACEAGLSLNNQVETGFDLPSCHHFEKCVDSISCYKALVPLSKLKGLVDEWELLGLEPEVL
jgi:hypothetical protein